MTALYLTENDVRELMDVKSALPIIEEAFKQYGKGRVSNVPRQRAKMPGCFLHTMSAAAEYLGMVGWKCYTTTNQGAKFLVGLFDAETGKQEALIEANLLGQIRTGAASGVATQYMARPDSQLVGIFGTGFQARSQLEAVCHVRKIKRVEVYSRNDEHRIQFAEEMSELCGVEVEPGHSPGEVAAEKDIVITATNSKTPLFDGHVLDEGTHLNVIGSNYLAKAEIDAVTVQRSDIIVCDSIEQCRLEAGDFVAAMEAGSTNWQQMHELANVVIDQDTGRAVPENITLFKSVGLALQDLALGTAILAKARDAGLGRSFPS